MATLGGLFGALALLVAALGMFGVLAFQVARRTNEIGVRMALGASRRTLMALVLREVAVMVVAGVSIGAGVALLVTGPARTMLFGLMPTDPSVFVVAAPGPRGHRVSRRLAAGSPRIPRGSARRAAARIADQGRGSITVKRPSDCS
jgi:predicted lysophospholipase L1 biosynthesis ABC-type transport system permease subunit